MTVYEKIDAQMQGKEYTPVWGVGQQLKDILRADAIHKEKGLKGVCIPPQEAEKIIREFYGLPEIGAAAPEPVVPASEDTGNALDLAEFF